MHRKIRSIAIKLRRLITYRYSVTATERDLMRRFSRFKTRVPGRCVPRVLVECVEELSLFCILGEVVSALQARGPLLVEQYCCRCFRAESSRSLRRYIGMAIEVNGLSDRKWKRLFGSYCNRTAFSAAGFITPWRSIAYFLKAWRIVHGVRSVDELVALKLLGIPVGDLVIDSFLRFKPSPEVNLRDPYLVMVVRQALKLMDLCQSYFTQHCPDLYLCNYATYVQHGIPVRVALKYGVRVQAFCSTTQEFSIRITPDHATHTKQVDNYYKEFLELPKKEEKLRIARDTLEKRLSGGIDVALAYMRSSAYADNGDQVPDVNGAAVIFLHDFYDSPHGYRWMLFHEFLSWVRFTLGVLTEAGLPVFVKPHPNQISVSMREIEQLKREFPSAKFISSQISNRQLVEAGMKCAVTVHGSVAAEMAFFGVPTICSGDNPHVAFNFCKVAKTRDGYAQQLREFPALNHDVVSMREEACMFYYMHNLNLNKDDREFRDTFMWTWARMLESQRSQVQDRDQLVKDLDYLVSMPGFRRFADGLHEYLIQQEENRWRSHVR